VQKPDVPAGGDGTTLKILVTKTQLATLDLGIITGERYSLRRV
jgi:hypothetical protein